MQKKKLPKTILADVHKYDALDIHPNFGRFRKHKVNNIILSANTKYVYKQTYYIRL